MERYYIKEDYIVNKINLTNDKHNLIKYWNKKNFAAKVYQLPVYEYLSSLIKKIKLIQ